MPELPPTNTALEQTSDLHSEIKTLTQLEAIALSNKPYWGKVRDYVNWQAGESLKAEIAVSVMTGGFIGLLTWLAGLATFDTVFWAGTTICAAFVACVVRHLLIGTSAINSVYERRLLWHTQRLEEQERYKLFLEVDTNYTLRNDWAINESDIGFVRESEKGYIVKGGLYVRFNNTDVHDCRVDGITVTLVTKLKQLTLTTLMRNEYGLIPMTGNKVYMTIPGSHRPWFVIECEGQLDETWKESLDEDSYLRIEMEAVRQKPYCVDLTANWDWAWAGRSTLQVKAVGNCSA
jgi:hypothetical protein